MAAPEAPRRPAASVVVCTFERPEHIGACLASIAASMGPADELIVVEAGRPQPTDPTEGLAVTARRLWCDPPGKSRQVNQAASVAGAGILLLTDDDCRVPPGWVDGMVAAFDDDRVGVAFGPVRGLSAVPGPPAPQLPPGPAPIEHWVYAHGASMAVRRDALVDVGGFDERLGPGSALRAGEEADLLLRLREAGWECRIAAAPVVEHSEWRTEAETGGNLLTYERGGGALLGAALRRHPLGSLKVLALRGKYQAQLWSRPGLRGAAFGPRSSLAFLGGVAAGLRLEARRFL